MGRRVQVGAQGGQLPLAGVEGRFIQELASDECATPDARSVFMVRAFMVRVFMVRVFMVRVFMVRVFMVRAFMVRLG